MLLPASINAVVMDPNRINAMANIKVLNVFGIPDERIVHDIQFSIMIKYASNDVRTDRDESHVSVARLSVWNASRAYMKYPIILSIIIIAQIGVATGLGTNSEEIMYRVRLAIAKSIIIIIKPIEAESLMFLLLLFSCQISLNPLSPVFLFLL